MVVALVDWRCASTSRKILSHMVLTADSSMSRLEKHFKTLNEDHKHKLNSLSFVCKLSISIYYMTSIT